MIFNYPKLLDRILLYLLMFLMTSQLRQHHYFLSKMSPQDGSCQKLRNCVYICWSYAEKTVDSFFPITVYINKTTFANNINA